MAKEYTQPLEIDYFETFSLVVCIETIRATCSSCITQASSISIGCQFFFSF